MVFIVLFVAVIRYSKQKPYLAVGWLWYLGTLVPVIGLIQGSDHTMADRYSYISLIGLFIIIAWGSSDFLSNRRWKKGILITSVVIVLSAFGMRTMMQVNHWKNNLTLYENAINADERNDFAHNNMGTALIARGELDQAAFHFRKALEINPAYADASINMANVLAGKGKFDEAEKYYNKTLKIKPEHAVAHYSLGLLFLRRNRLHEAYAYFAKAILINPDFAEAYDYMGLILSHQGNLQKAGIFFFRAVQISPDFAKARKHLENNSKKLLDKRTLNGR